MKADKKFTTAPAIVNSLTITTVEQLEELFKELHEGTLSLKSSNSWHALTPESVKISDDKKYIFYISYNSEYGNWVSENVIKMVKIGNKIHWNQNNLVVVSPDIPEKLLQPIVVPYSD